MRWLIFAFAILVWSCAPPKADNYEKMRDKYNKLLGNHHKTGGVILLKKDLLKAIEGLDPEDTIRIVNARYLRGDIAHDGKKRRTTYLLWLPAKDTNGKRTGGMTYFDLETIGTLCPEPSNCQ